MRVSGLAAGMDARVRCRLSTMMALVYAVQGAFWPLLAVHLKDLGVAGRQRGWIFATLAIGSFAMPLGAGQLVDRFAGRADAAGPDLRRSRRASWWRWRRDWHDRPLAIFALFLVFWMVTAPAFALANAIALRHLPRPSRAVRRGPALGHVRLDGRRLGRLGGDGLVRARRARAGGLRGLLGRRRPWRCCWRSTA